MPNMDFQNVELTIEDILFIHRHWIVKLYVEDRKTEREIVDLLHQRRLPVTCARSRPLLWHSKLTVRSISQLRRCLEDWNLIRRPSTSSTYSSSSSASSISTSTSSSTTDADFGPNDWHVLSISTSLPSYESRPRFAELYTRRPLPPLPPSQSMLNDSQRKRKRPKSSILQVTTGYNGLSRLGREMSVKMTLGLVPQWPSVPPPSPRRGSEEASDESE